MRTPIIIAVLMLSACAPSRLQQTTIDGIDPEGRTVYSMSGYGDPEDMAARSSEKHVRHALSDACPNGVTILQLEEIPTGSMISNFMYWKAKARCN